jgi:hypothetical protein
MSITITIPGVDRSGGAGRVVCDLRPLMGSMLLPAAEELVPGLGIAVAVTKLLGLRVGVDR